MQNPARKLATAALAWLLALALAACATDDGDSLQAAALRPNEYRIGPADVLTISILNQDDMDRTVTVRPDGMISFPLLDEIPAAGRTPVELEEMLVTGLSEYMELLPGELTVVVDEVHSFTVSVLGEVRNPGRFEFQNNVTVLDALAEAGGLTEFASESRILILRPEGASVRRIRFNYDDLMSESREDLQLALYPGDTVLVP